MAYIKNTWKKGDTITSAKLNNIEKGIEDANTMQGIKGDKGDKGVGIKTITGSMGGDSGNDLTLVFTLTDNTTQNVTVTLPII